jgi:hypothetical protein
MKKNVLPSKLNLESPVLGAESALKMSIDAGKKS